MHWMVSDFSAELIGTMIMILLGDGVVANVLLSKSKGQNSGWIVITAGWAFAVSIAVYVTGWVSGAQLNPAITIALCLAGNLPYSVAASYITGQFIGAGIGSYLVFLSYRSHWKETENQDYKLLIFCTMPAIRKYSHNLMTEIIGTAVLLLGVLGISDTHNGLASGVAPIAIGILIFAIGLSLGGPTGYAINPVRDLMPRFMHFILPIEGKRNSDWKYAWVPVVGPIIGAIIGTFIYKILVYTIWIH